MFEEDITYDAEGTPDSYYDDEDNGASELLQSLFSNLDLEDNEDRMKIVQEEVQEKAQEEITFNRIEEELLLALNCDFSEKNIFSQYITVEERENWVL